MIKMKTKNSEFNRRYRKKLFLRVVKQLLKPKNIIVLIIILSANTFAWFVYVKEVHSNIDVKVRAWNVVLTNSDSEVISNLNIDISSAFPGMSEYSNDTKVYNQGDTMADFEYTILSLKIFDNIIETKEKYLLDKKVPGDDVISSDELIRELESGDNYPFRIILSSSNNKLDAFNGESLFNIKMNWDYESGNDELDTIWGKNAYDFKKNHPTESPLKLVIKLKITQSNV